MDSKADMYFKRAKTELEAAEILDKVSKNNDAKQNFDISPESTYYSGVISHAYYAIFSFCKAIYVVTQSNKLAIMPIIARIQIILQ